MKGFRRGFSSFVSRDRLKLGGRFRGIWFFLFVSLFSMREVRFYLL